MRLLLGSLAAALVSACSSAPVGEVETLAGGPTEGFVDGVGPEARFGPPGDVVVDSNGVLYVADVFNSAIRRVTPDGEVTTLAGGEEGFADGVGTLARFHLPYGLALVDDELLYVADAFNAVIRQIDLRTGEVTTIVGHPDETGHVDGPLEDALFDAPFDIDVEPGTGRIWVVDTNNNAIRLVDLEAREVSTIAGAEARFNRPAGIVPDGEGGAWVTDRINNTIRRVRADGTVRTVLGVELRAGFQDGLGQDALLSRPTGIASTADGWLVFSDQENNILRLFVPEEGTRPLAGIRYNSDALPPPLPEPQDGPAGDAYLRDPRGIAIDNEGTIYFADLYAVRVLRAWNL